MKHINIFTLLLFTLLVHSCSEESNNKTLSDLESSNLLGPVKSLSSTNYVQFDTISDSTNKCTYFDLNGFISKEETNHRFSRLIQRDEANRIKNIFNLNQDSDTLNVLKYEYSDDCLIKIIELIKDKENSKWIYENYDNCKKKSESLFRKNQLITKFEYSYSEDELTETINIYTDKNKLDKVITTKSFPEKMSMETRTKWFLDKTHTVDLQLILHYDQYKNIVEQFELRDGDTLSSSTFSYEFDQHNNWTIQSVIEKDISIIKSKRIIEYY